MTTRRNLPVGVQDFEKLRNADSLYIDKTAYIYQLSNTIAPYFLARPRRFGKSLFLSTLKAYFLGKKALFDGLAIADLEKEWVEYPVFYFDFNVGDYTDAQSFRDVLHIKLSRLDELWDKNTKEMDVASRFEALIRHAHEKTKQKVVVLVDEYDKPLLATMDDPKLNDQIRTILKSFYGVLKSSDAYLRFVFLTGVTKFSRVSIFSDLNQLQDISLHHQYSGICGISQTELIENFQPEIASLSEALGMTYDETLAQLKKQYDGYHFSEVSEDMYNPFSLLNTFSAKWCRNYWYQTGTPTFLVKMLKDFDFDIKSLENDVYYSAQDLFDYKVEDPDPIPVLYQSGYLTIKEYNRSTNEYRLGYPNEEVKYGFMNNLLPAYVPKKQKSVFSSGNFIRDLEAGNVDAFMKRLQSFFAGIPNELNNKTEKHYQTVFYLLFRLMGEYIQAEESSSIGRADAVAVVGDTVFIFEFKLTERATAEEALQQIDDRKYAAQYAVGGKKVVKVGAEFNAEERTLSRWVWKHVESDLTGV